MTYDHISEEEPQNDNAIIWLMAGAAAIGIIEQIIKYYTK